MIKFLGYQTTPGDLNAVWDMETDKVREGKDFYADHFNGPVERYKYNLYEKYFADGSEEHPWTLETAMEKTVPGDTTWCKTGTYDMSTWSGYLTETAVRYLAINGVITK